MAVPGHPLCRLAASNRGVLLPYSIREFLRCRVLRPLLRLLRGGVSPRRIAWSLALGMVIGINPTVGLTTLILALLAWSFGLSQVASHLGSWVVAPLHLLLFIPFIQLGVFVFHTRRLPVSRHQFHWLAHHPVLFFRDLGQWIWHGIVVWAIASAILLPVLAFFLRRAIILLKRRHRTLLRTRPANAGPVLR